MKKIEEQLEELIKKNDIIGAIYIIKIIKDDFWKTKEIIKLINYIVENNIEDQENLIDGIMEIIMEMDKNKNSALYELNKILIKNNYFDKAIEIINLTTGIEKNYAIKSILEKISIIYLKNKKLSHLYIDRLIFIVSKIKIKENREMALKDIVEFLTYQGEYNKAIAVSSKMHKTQKYKALESIVKGLSKIKNYNKAIEITTTIKKSECKSEALRSIIRNMVNNKKENLENQKTFSELLNIASEINNEYEKAGALRELVLSLINIGNFERALSISKSINDTFWKSDSQMNIAIALSKEGKFDEAIEIIKSISDNLKKIRAFNTVIDEMMDSGYIFEKDVEELKKNIIFE